jgi:superfamily II DNA or RNA helicase
VNFLDTQRLLKGPWQAFERDVARLLVASGFDDVRIVGGTGDRGADVLGVAGGKVWVFQCKFTSSSSPPTQAVDEVVEAGRYYHADRLWVATSRPIGESFSDRIRYYTRQGLNVEVAQPADLIRLAATAPEYPKSRLTLHDYQEETVERLRSGLLDTGRALIVLATGLGKTVVMAETVAELLRENLIAEGRVLVLAHTVPIVSQLHRAFWHQLPKWVSTHQLSEGEFPSYWDGITFATMQSALAASDRLPIFGLVLIDEAHHVGADTYQELIQSLRPRMLGGVTATPWRGDGYDIENTLGPPLVRIGIAEGLKRGFLADVDYRLLADNIDWEFVQARSQHGYALSQLNSKLILPMRDERAAQIIADAFTSQKRRAAIIFTRSIEHANAFAGTMRSYDFKAEPISSDMSPRERDLLLAQFRAGRMDFICAVDLFNEGVDFPDVDLLAFMRVTHSRRIFVQQLGRGLRTRPGKKNVIVLDFVTDLRRIAEVLSLDQAIRGGDVERVGLGEHLVEFNERGAGDFLRDWLLDQASLFDREGDPVLELPQLDFPPPVAPGSVQ